MKYLTNPQLPKFDIIITDHKKITSYIKKTKQIYYYTFALLGVLFLMEENTSKTLKWLPKELYSIKIYLFLSLLYQFIKINYLQDYSIIINMYKTTRVNFLVNNYIYYLL